MIVLLKRVFLVNFLNTDESIWGCVGESGRVLQDHVVVRTMDGMLKDEKFQASDSQDTDKKKGGVEMKPAGGIHRGGDNDGEDDGGQRKKQLISKAKKTGKERRRERRLRNEPQNFIGE